MTEEIDGKTYSKIFPELSSFLGGYFHQEQFAAFDWGSHQKSYEGIVRFHKSRESKAVLEKEIKELILFLQVSKDWDEDKLFETLLYDFGGTLSAYRFNMTYREFLEGVLEILQEPIEKTKNAFVPRFIG